MAILNYRSKYMNGECLKDNQEVMIHRTTHTLIFGGTEPDSAGSNPHLLQTGADQHSWMHCDLL